MGALVTVQLLLIVFLLTIGVATAILSVGKLHDDARQSLLLSSAQEMEINVREQEADLFRFLETGDTIHHDRMLENLRDLRVAASEYQSHVRTDASQARWGVRLTHLIDSTELAAAALSDLGRQRQAKRALVGRWFAVADSLLDEHVQAARANDPLWRARSDELEINLKGALLSITSSSDQPLESWRVKFEDSRRDFGEHLEHLRRLARSVDEHRLVQELSVIAGRIMTLGAELNRLRAAEARQFDDFSMLVHTVAETMLDDSVQVEAMARANTARAGIEKTFRTALIIGGALVVFGLVFGGWFGFQMYRRTRLTARELVDSERAYREVVEHAVYGICRLTPDGRITAANAALVLMLGYPDAADLAVDSGTALFADPDAMQAFSSRCAATHDSIALETTWKRRDGKTVAVRLNGRAIRSAGGEPLACELFVEDVTERLALEQNLRQSQKMEAVGQLTSGIAHDFNNLLAVLQFNAELLGNDPDPTRERTARRGGTLLAVAQRGAAMVRKLLVFSRQVPMEIGSLPLARVLGDVIELVQPILPASMTLNYTAVDGLPDALVDESAVHQIMLNLMTNARDAMGGVGPLRIHVDGVPLSAADQLPRWVPPGEYVRVLVTDTGAGMNEPTVAKAFDPFFTTKPSGTGLGLAMVYGLMKLQAGHVFIDSRPGRGTTVTLLFPIAPPPPVARQYESAGSAAAAVRPGTLPSRSGRTVLIVEDEPEVRASLQEVLTAAGFTVILAADGVEALALLNETARRPDLVLADVVMPRMSGPKLYETTRSMGLSLPFLLMSAHAGREMPEGVEYETVALQVLSKPLSSADLVAALDKAIGAVAEC